MAKSMIRLSKSIFLLRNDVFPLDYDTFLLGNSMFLLDRNAFQLGKKQGKYIVLTGKDVFFGQQHSCGVQEVLLLGKIISLLCKVLFWKCSGDVQGTFGTCL